MGQPAIGHRRGLLYGWIYDQDAERRRARVDLPVEQLDLTTWTHVGYTYDEETARLYVDGELVDEQEDDYPLAFDPLGACLGYIYEERDTGVHTPPYSGRLPDARFYDRALSADSIERLYRVTAPG